MDLATASEKCLFLSSGGKLRETGPLAQQQDLPGLPVAKVPDVHLGDAPSSSEDCRA